MDLERYLAFNLQAFNGKKWEKFNSEKVASLAYARIQGRTALISHFQNSSLMNEDKRCRPILFHPNGLESGNQVNSQLWHFVVEDNCMLLKVDLVLLIPRMKPRKRFLSMAYASTCLWKMGQVIHLTMKTT